MIYSSCSTVYTHCTIAPASLPPGIEHLHCVLDNLQLQVSCVSHVPQPTFTMYLTFSHRRSGGSRGGSQGSMDPPFPSSLHTATRLQQANYNLIEIMHLSMTIPTHPPVGKRWGFAKPLYFDPSTSGLVFCTIPTYFRHQKVGIGGD